ncbi:nitroreductase/quinone reductase family protein [Cellulomonas edaphi]|uniref:Nitroreductase/quinone reductase family protein n=1 Tax=Cellulomonas edaphi TaxID=3053468 RepID=A0ABT7S2T3_9CELL|nr:nitroreductase/quinone reductase family protein [Cellulomons edaphi]MDM7829925.1 nitroreductase/quinone reductase family protein [Cellulomons edaphi]
MASTRTMKTLSVLHRAAVRVSRGRVGGRLLGDPALELTTTGRRSGRPRVSMLTAPLQLGDSLVVVASRGGDDVHPAWFLNLRDDPHVQVALAGGPRRPMLARVADADERARLWPAITAGSPHYAAYQQRTTREIPVVLLEQAHDVGVLP